MKVYVVDTHQKLLSEMLLMSTHNICFSWRNKKNINTVDCLFVLRFYGPVNTMGASAVSLPNHTFTGQA